MGEEEGVVGEEEVGGVAEVDGDRDIFSLTLLQRQFVDHSII